MNFSSDSTHLLTYMEGAQVNIGDAQAPSEIKVTRLSSRLAKNSPMSGISAHLDLRTSFAGPVLFRLGRYTEATPNS